MIVETYRTSGNEGNRYVRKEWIEIDLYLWWIQNKEKTNMDVAQGTCLGADLPVEIKILCDEHKTNVYTHVWPKE
jgi:hypothetical protein